MADFSKPGTLLITCGKGVHPYLQRELKSLGFNKCVERPAGIETKGTLLDCMRLNLHLRTAHRVLYKISAFKCAGPNDLYHRSKGVQWESIIPADGYVSVEANADKRLVKNSMFAGLKVKDAICDRIRNRKNTRPDSGPDKDRACVVLHWHDGNAALFLDTSGESLSNRGYRLNPHKAPMRETIAAAVLMASGYQGRGPVVNPMCGSGTLAIEAALFACNVAPGLLRNNFSFMHLIGFDADEWASMRTEARKAMLDSPDFAIVATDIDSQAIKAARANAAEAGMDQFIRFDTCDFKDTQVPEHDPDAPGLFIVNPEYGMRLGEAKALEPVYSGIGDFMKQACGGYTGAVFTGNLKLAKRIGLKTSKRIPMHNGPIECRILLYELYAGSRKNK